MHFQPPGGHLAQEEPLPPGGEGERRGVEEEGPKNRPTATPGDSGTFGTGRV